MNLNVTIRLFGCCLILLSFYSQAQELQWAKIGNARAIDLTVDSNNELIVAGVFDSTIAFGSTTFSGAGAFVSKFDENGLPIWAVRIDKAGIGGLCSDAQNNVIVTGWFSSATIVVGNYTLQNAGGNDPGSTQGPGPPCTDLFLTKLDQDGNFVWAIRAGGQSNE